MSRISQSQKIVSFLKAHSLKPFSAKEIASAIIAQYPEDYHEKRQNPRFADDKAFLQQIIAEIGSQKQQILNADLHVFWKDKPRPRVYWYNPNATQTQEIAGAPADDLNNEGRELEEASNVISGQGLTGYQLYPLLVHYLKSELHLYCQRIDEQRSINQRGSGGNQWLHPDIVAMQPVDKSWDTLVRTCVQKGGGQSVRLWSFEVKKELNSSNVRRSFFQAVSNSSWANEGYLVAMDIANNVHQELRMLSALHGIGVILLFPENLSESEIFLPAIAKPEFDWQSVNRIVLENEDVKDFVELISTYYQTGRIRGENWNRV